MENINDVLKDIERMKALAKKEGTTFGYAILDEKGNKMTKKQIEKEKGKITK